MDLRARHRRGAKASGDYCIRHEFGSPSPNPGSAPLSSCHEFSSAELASNRAWRGCRGLVERVATDGAAVCGFTHVARIDADASMRSASRARPGVYLGWHSAWVDLRLAQRLTKPRHAADNRFLLLLLLLLRKTQKQQLLLIEQLESWDSANVGAEHPCTMFGGAELVRARRARTRKRRVFVIRVSLLVEVPYVCGRRRRVSLEKCRFRVGFLRLTVGRGASWPKARRRREDVKQVARSCNSGAVVGGFGSLADSGHRKLALSLKAELRTVSPELPRNSFSILFVIHRLLSSGGEVHE